MTEVLAPPSDSADGAVAAALAPAGASPIGKIRRVELREVWKHEAMNFTTWLQNNLDVLNEALDVPLTSAEREQAAGSFSVDLVAEDESGALVIVENQLEKSDHDHLGKLITYLAAYEAKTAIWLVADPRPEHIRAVTWLNETSADFYLLKIEAIRIGDSPAALLVTRIVGPSEETREVGDAKKEWADRHHLRLKFWTELLERAKTMTKLHANISPGRDHWQSATAGKRGLAYSYLILQHAAAVELYIDRGKDSQEENKRIFDTLWAAREAVEASFGAPLEWERLETKRASRIRKTLHDGGLRDEERWPAIQDAMITAMVRLEAAMRPHIDGLST